MIASVVIPTYNRAEVLKKTVLSLVKTKNKNYNWEIVIVDDGSDEKNRELNKKLTIISKKVKLYMKNNGGPASARNLAIQKAKGEILIFINDDTLVDDYFIDKHINFHQYNKNLNIGLVGQYLVPNFELKSPAMLWFLEKSGLNFFYDEKRIINNFAPWYYFWTCNLSVKKLFFSKNNLHFDEDFKMAAWEDVEFGYRADKCGLKLKFDKKLIAYHNHNFTYNEVLSRFFGHGRGLYVLRGKLPSKLWTPLMKDQNRFLISFLLPKRIMTWIENFLRDRRYLPNLLMQILIIYKRVEGYKYEERIFKKSDKIVK